MILRYACVVVLVLTLYAGAFVKPASAKLSAEKADKAVKLAKHQLGVRYVWGAESPGRAFDCSGFTRWVLGKLGFRLPHLAAAQLGMGKRVARRYLKPGDLVFFNSGGHVGMYLGHGRFIHASSARGRVVVTRLSGYGLPFDGGRRFLKWRP